MKPENRNVLLDNVARPGANRLLGTPDYQRENVDRQWKCARIFRGLQAELLSGFETYVPMPGGRLCSLVSYCRIDRDDHIG